MIPGTKRIIIIGPAYPLRGGLATFNERLASALQAQGHQVIVYTFRLQYPRIFFPGKTQLSVDPPPENLEIRVRINSVNPLNWFCIGREISRLRADLVIIRFWLPFMGPCLGTLARMIRRNGASSIITLADNIIPHESRLFDNHLTSYYLKGSDGFVFMSRSVMNDLNRFDTIKPRTFCPHPVYDTYGPVMSKTEARKALGFEQKYHYLLFFGFIRDYKGLDLLLYAMGDKRLKSLPIRLIIAGEYYTDPQPYRQIIEQEQIADRVLNYNDFIPNLMVGRFFCAADLVVQPYKSATQSGVSQIAYHFEKPMIITDVGGLSEMVPHGRAGYVVEPIPERLADAIVDYFMNHEETDFVPFLREEKKKYTWDNMIVHIFAMEERVKEQKRLST